MTKYEYLRVAQVIGKALPHDESIRAMVLCDLADAFNGKANFDSLAFFNAAKAGANTHTGADV